MSNSSSFESLLHIAHETASSPNEIALAIAERLPEGGIAIHGGSQAKIDSIAESGLDPSLSSRYPGKTFIVTTSGHDHWKEAEKHALVNDLARGVHTAALFATRSLPRRYRDMQEIAEDEARPLPPEQTPAVVLFGSQEVEGRAYKLDEMGSVKWPGSGLQSTREMHETLPPQLIVGSCALEKVDITNAWRRSQADLPEQVGMIQGRMAFGTPAPTDEAGLDGWIDGLDFLSTEQRGGLRTLFDADNPPTQQQIFERLHQTDFREACAATLSEKTVLKVNELYGKR